ncbi:MAG: preprotein translocase subunit SecA [Pirellula sp.]
MSSLLDPTSDNSAEPVFATGKATLPPKSTANAKLHLPYRPHVSAGWILPGVARYKVNQWLEQTRAVNALEDARKALTEPQIRKEALSLVYRAKSGESLSSLLPEAYSLIREAGNRALNMRHYDVQILGGICLFNSCIAEMQTGEGKTLTATLPLVLHSLVGKGAHLATVNDYLAHRDAEWMKPIYEMLGFRVGTILEKQDQDQRRKGYGADVTYGTAKEIGFDFLRDRLLMRAQGRAVDDFLGTGSQERWTSAGEQPVQRGMHFCLVDEADSILIDEARTPLIIGSRGGEERQVIAATYKWGAEHASKFIDKEHFKVDEDSRKIELNARGRQFVRSLPRDELVRTVALVDLYEYAERAIKVHRDFHLNRQYVIRDNEIVIVDEFTGRLAEGRKWRDGIHQAIEAKENLTDVANSGGTAARITIQDLFLRYKSLAGMTGTAATSARELRRIYKTPVVQVPTNRPPHRKKLTDSVHHDMTKKFEAIVEEVKAVNAIGRPVLIGTRSIDKSHTLAEMLRKEGLEVQVLNANEVERESEIVSKAGVKSQITVATNMAGRGTDIKLDDEVRALGGMMVICTELHDAARIDRQLIGRCGRQGDPGTYRQYLSMDDEILRNGFGLKSAEKLAKLGASGGSLSSQAPRFKRAQRKVERKHFRDRMALMHHEKERTKIQREMGQDPYLDSAE